MDSAAAPTTDRRVPAHFPGERGSSGPDEGVRSGLRIAGAIVAAIAVLVAIAEFAVGPRLLPAAATAPHADPGVALVARGLVVAGVILGLLVHVVARHGRMTTRQLVHLGLFTELLGALLLATHSLLVHRTETSAGLDPTVDGPTLVGLWVLLLPLAVRPSWTWALAVGLVSVALEPGLILLQSTLATTLETDVGATVWAFRANYLCAALAVLPALALERSRRRADEERRRAEYAVEERIDGAGPGEVWRATHPRLVRPVAVRIVRPARGAASEPSPTVLDDFARAAAEAAQLESPHTVATLDHGLAADGTFYVVSEWLTGLDLQRLVEDFGPLPEERVGYLLGQVCHALHDAHLRGLAHGDLKPANVFTCVKGIEVDFVKVGDFGLDAPVIPEADGARGVARGTPAVLAPERVSGAPPDVRSDLYALGCLAHWLLCAEPVFAGGPVEVMARQLGDEPTPIRERIERTLDPGLEAVVTECLRKDPAARPVDAREVGRRIAATGLAGRWSESECRAWWHDHAPEMLGESGGPSGDPVEAGEPPVGTTLRTEDESAVPAAPEPSFFRRRAARRRDTPEGPDHTSEA
ncbi:MAG TPA: serine/threonine-protein kinase [Candidatus Krumholzibacteria bacterium]|nr:serine/threonine-protein kinase [Candidatus Krumholzibacteria bacterium]